jgi:hypothetical protein
MGRARRRARTSASRWLSPGGRRRVRPRACRTRWAGTAIRRQRSVVIMAWPQREELHAGVALPGRAAAVPGVRHDTSGPGARKRPGGGGTVPNGRSLRSGDAHLESARPDADGAQLDDGGAKPGTIHPDIVGDAPACTAERAERNTDGRLDALTAPTANGSSPIPHRALRSSKMRHLALTSGDR